ncbi:hypothetical protein [Persicitalea sp.]|uniref:hypothetical protein n=1 Tax=Persicitalea sp. TaxID=3100273 RepID=UPI003592FFFD
MDFQELSTLWNNNDQELSQQIEIRQKLVEEVSIRKVRRHLAEIKWTSYFELGVSFIFLPFITRYLSDTFSESKFFIPGLMLLVLTLFSLLFTSYQLVLYYGIQTGTSVVQTQLKVARLRFLESLEINLLYIVIPLFYAPFMIVVAKAVANFDLYQFSNLLIYSTSGSVVIALILVFFLKKFPSKRLRESLSFLNELKEGNAHSD